MNKKLRYSLLMLLLAVFSGAWAGESEVYNFAFKKQSGPSGYANTYTVTIGDKSWTIPGNLTNGDYLRIGGKEISEVDRVIQCNDALTGNISKIVFNHNGKSRNNVTVHSVTLTVANDGDFSDVVDEVVVSNPAIEKSVAGEIVFEPSTGIEWNGDLYYRFTVNISNSDSSNGGLDLTSLVFYENVAGAVDPSVSFANESETIEIGETVTNELTKPSDLTVTYSSNPASVATVDENGVVTGVAEGEATITASWEAVADKYNAGSVSYTVTVTPVAPTVNFVKVTDSSQIVAGNEYILVGSKGSSTAAMGKRTGTNTYRDRVEVTVNEDNVAVKERDGIAVLTLGGSSDAWTFLASDNDEYLALTSDGNALHSSTDETLETSQWTITDDFQVKSATYNRYIQYNSGSTRFACYTSGQGTATLYVKGESPVVITEFNPTFSPVPGEVDKNTEVTVTANDEWVFYFYTLNNSQNVFGDETTKTFTVNITEDTELVVCGINTLDPSIENQVVTVNYTVNPESADYVTVTLPYEETLISSQGNFVVEGDACWTFGNYGAVASKKNVTSWLVSPLIDAEDVSEEITLTFEHQGRYFTTPSEEATLWVREAGGEWNQLEITYTDAFTGSKWTTFSEVTVDLSDYAGTTFQIAYKYTSSDSYGGWEVKNVNIVAGEPVVKQDADLSFDVENFTATIGEENEFPVLNNPNELDVTYRSTNTSIATIDEDGNIELLTAGQTTIIAEFAGDETFNEGSASYQLVVKEQVIAGTDKYELVTDATTLAADDEIIFVGTTDEETFYAMSTTQNPNNRAANEVEIEDDGTIIPGSDIQIFTLEEGDTGFAFYTGSGYIYAASSGSNWLRTETEADDNAYATIDIDDEKGEATVVFQGSNTRNHMRFNPNNGNPMFSCYAETSSIQNMPRIYRKVAEPEMVTIEVGERGAVSFSSTYPLDFADADVHAYIVTEKKGSYFNKIEVTQVPANTGIVVEGAPGEYQVPIAETTPEALEDNLLVATSTGAYTVEEADYGRAYGLFYSTTKKAVGFKKMSLGKTIDVNKCYILLPEASGAEEIFFTIDGIDNIEQTAPVFEGTAYNLNGQKVNASYKGVIIVNGKKVINK